MFSTQLRPLVGGAERQTEKLAVALASAGWRVTILTPRTDPESPAEEESDGVRIIRFVLDDLSVRYPIKGVALLNIPYMLWQLVRKITPYVPGEQVLHCHMGSLQSGGAALAGRLAGLSVICTAATAHDRSDLGKLVSTGPTGRIVAALVKTFVQTWVASTDAVKEALLRAGISADKIVTIPNGVSLPAESHDTKPTRRVRRFLYLGRMSTTSERDIPTLITAFDRLARKFPEAELALVGGGNLLDETIAFAKSHDARDRIHFPGFDDPEKWLAWADCFVLPSRYEGLSNALLEAMAARLPCIANDIPPNREVLDAGEAGVLVPVGSVDSLETAMLEFAENAAIADVYGRKGKERVRNVYTIEAVAKKYGNLYNSLIAADKISGD